VLLKKVVKPLTVHFGSTMRTAGISNLSEEQAKKARMEKSIASYVPEVVLNNLLAGQNEWIGELRLVTILFINIGLSAVMKSLEIMNQAFKAIQTAMYRHEGECNKILFDDKGLVVLCAMGLEMAHPDDSIRAVVAALFAHEKLEELDVRCSIGIATGKVFCGSYGNDIRHDYSVIGKTVNLASRLMSVAKNGILCDSTTYEASKERITYFNSTEKIHVKGFDQAIAVYTPLKTQQQQQRSQTENGWANSFIGRQKEKTVVAEMIQALKTQQQTPTSSTTTASGCKVLVLEGEGTNYLSSLPIINILFHSFFLAGIGKSRFLSEIIRIADSFLLKTVISAADSFERYTPFFMYREILLQLFNLKEKMDSLGEKGAAEYLRTMLSLYNCEQYLPLMNDFLPFQYPENHLTKQMNAQLRAESISDFVQKVLTVYTQDTPLVIIMDDCQWMDSASWSLTLRICQHVSHLLVIISTRPLEYKLAPHEYLLIRKVEKG
jgi:class 3 adenylate cyclase